MSQVSADPGTRLRRRGRADGWLCGSLLLVAAVLFPFATLVSGASGSAPEWEHVTETVLRGYVMNTLILVVLVLVFSCVMALPAAWFVTAFEFPGRRIFQWALVLPLAIPTYVAAFVYIGIPEQAIPLSIWIRTEYGVDAFLWFDKIMRYGLLSLFMAGVLYPYLYLSARSSFEHQQKNLIEAARSLGAGPFRIFFGIVLPLARPAIVAGLSLIVMEVVNDYGAVEFFGVPTLTVGIFRTWFGLEDQGSALRIAGVTVAAIFAFLALERLLRGRGRFSEVSGGGGRVSRRKLSAVRGIGASFVCLVPLIIGFIFPAGVLLKWSLQLQVSGLGELPDARLFRSLLLASGTAVALVLVAVFLTYSCRVRRCFPTRIAGKLAGTGYALPGAVVAVSVLSFSSWWDGLTGQFLTGSLMLIAFAYFVRFTGVALFPVQSASERICGSLDEASRTLGCSPLKTLLRVNLPLLKGTMAAAAMLVFVDLLKELPLTMILSPANFETLSTTAFGLAKEGRLYECAAPSLMIVCAGAAGLLVLNKLTGTRKD